MDVSAVSSPFMDQLGSVQGQVQVTMFKKAMDLQASQALQLLQALPQPALATPGQPGAIVNTYA